VIIAGTRPPEYDAALRAARARRAREQDPLKDGDQPDTFEPEEPERSAVDIAPRPPSD
jgi:hypothetical protein